MQSRWRALLACRGLCEPLEAAQFGFCGEQFTVCKGALELAYARTTRCHTLASITCRGDAHAHDQCGSRTCGLWPSPRVMSSMHR